MAEVLRELGHPKEALHEYDHLKKEYPFEYMGWLGAGDVYRDLKKYDQARSEYDEAIRRFPNDSPPRLRSAQLFKTMGNFEKALQTYSAIAAEFPTSIFARLGQANLFKELGRYDAALASYIEISTKDKQFQRDVDNSVAAIFVAHGNFERAQLLLPDIRPRTKAEWVAHHIRGMILLKTAKLSEAIEHFRWSLENIPFKSKKLYFENALALARLRSRQFREAAEVLGDGPEPISNLLRLHAFCGLNDIPAAEFAYSSLQNDCPENIILIRDELGAHLKLNKRSPQRSADWIFEQECDVVALYASTMQIAA